MSTETPSQFVHQFKRRHLVQVSRTGPPRPFPKLNQFLLSLLLPLPPCVATTLQSLLLTYHRTQFPKWPLWLPQSPTVCIKPARFQLFSSGRLRSPLIAINPNGIIDARSGGITLTLAVDVPTDKCVNATSNMKVGAGKGAKNHLKQ